MAATGSVRPSVPIARLVSTSSTLLYAPSASASLATSAGSGQGGKAEKEAAKKDKERQRKEREALKKEREKERARKDKERARLVKEREKLKAQKEKDKLKALREREKAKQARLAEKKPRTTSVVRPPKAPTNAWPIFLADFIAARKRELGAGEKMGSLAEMTRAAGLEYANISPDDKAKLDERAAEQRAAYPAILAAWQKTLTPEMIKEENAVRATRRKLGLSRKGNLKMVGEPKRPKTAYFAFLDEHRRAAMDSEVLRGESNIIEQSKLLANAWRQLSESEKEKYEEISRTDKARYETEKAAFEAEHARPSA